MRTLLLLLLCLTACLPGVDTRDLQRCDAQDPTVDCCSDAEQCLTHFGSEFPYCTTPGPDSGRCVECTLDAHCTIDSYCVLDAPNGPFCAPLPVDR